MQTSAPKIPTRSTWNDAASDFADLPDDLRPHANALLVRFMSATEEWALSRQEIVCAITSASFRPILEQEAKLSRLGLAS